MEALIAIILLGPLAGFELAVAAVVNPLAAPLPDSAYRVIRSGGSTWLGRLMPFWYIAALVALVATAITAGGALVIIAGALMGVALLLTVTILVPINNRVAAWRTDADVDRALAGRWDRVHWLRVALLTGAFVLVAISAA